MDTKEYIESGIIESYVLGSVSDQERREVECMSAIYPELKQHLLETQRSFEEFAQSMAMTPPPEVKAALLENIKSIPQEGKTTASGQTEAKQEAKIVQLPVAESKSSNWKWLAAASILLLLGAGSLYLVEKSNATRLNQDLLALKSEKEQEAEKTKQLQSELTAKESAQQLIVASNTVTVKLAGTPLSPDADVKVYYNSEKGKAFLTTPQLPTPAADKQYQLWALVDGKPVDLGVFDHDSTTGFGSMIPIDLTNIQAFAITLEKKGGSPTPNLEQLYVIGNI